MPRHSPSAVISHSSSRLSLEIPLRRASAFHCSLATAGAAAFLLIRRQVCDRASRPGVHPTVTFAYQVTAVKKFLPPPSSFPGRSYSEIYHLPPPVAGLVSSSRCYQSAQLNQTGAIGSVWANALPDRPQKPRPVELREENPRDLLRQMLRDEFNLLAAEKVRASVSLNSAATDGEIPPSDEKMVPKTEPSSQKDKPPPPTPSKSGAAEKRTETKSVITSTNGPVEKNRQWLKLGTFNGRTSIEAFLRRFEICSKHNGWTEEDRVSQLMCSLTEPASHILCESNTTSEFSSSDLVDVLRSRYGSANQASLYQTQLSTRRQKEGEDLSTLAQDIRRLLTLAYPGPGSVHRETIAIRAFIDAMRDKVLALKVREREPATLDDAVKLALRLECYQKTEDEGREVYERRPGRIKSVKEDGVSAETLRQILKEELESHRQRLDRFEKDLGSIHRRLADRPVSHETSKENPTWSGPPRQFNGRGHQVQSQSNRRSGHRDNRCYECHGTGHFARSCPLRRGEQLDNSEERGQATTEGESANVCYVQGSTNAYLSLRVHGSRLNALIDTGSELSLAPASIIHRRDLIKSEQVLRAANATEIKVLGETTLKCEADGFTFEVHCLVTEQLSELILGLDWLEQHKATWNFEEHWIKIGEHALPLHRGATRRGNTCRKIVTARNVEIPALSEMDVETFAVLPNLQVEDKSWATQPKVLDSGLVVAGTLLPSRTLDIAVRVLNPTRRSIVHKERSAESN